MFDHPTIYRVLIWALLLCHGVFGALHVAADPVFAEAAPASLSAGEYTTTHHASEHHDVTGHGERHADHEAKEYFAVLLGNFFVGLALLMLLRNVSRAAKELPRLPGARGEVSARSSSFRKDPRSPACRCSDCEALS